MRLRWVDTRISVIFWPLSMKLVFMSSKINNRPILGNKKHLYRGILGIPNRLNKKFDIHYKFILFIFIIILNLNYSSFIHKLNKNHRILFLWNKILKLILLFYSIKIFLKFWKILLKIYLSYINTIIFYY